VAAVSDHNEQHRAALDTTRRAARPCRATRSETCTYLLTAGFLSVARQNGHVRSIQDQAVSGPSNVKSCQDATGHNEHSPASQSKFTARPSQASLPGHEKLGFSPYAIFSRSSTTSSHPIDPTRSSQSAATTVATSLLRSLRLLARHHPAVQSAPSVGTVVDQLVHGTRHRCGTDRLERGSQPEPDGPRPARHAGQTYNAGPRSSGDRASVS
jgi:hypothetical protein